jgi:serine/threonine protein kinase/tetratricopeptide (TPR) repeat protein
MIGDTISHYRILEKLGRGGMGEVYKAEDTRLRRTVALKFLTPQLTLDEDAKTRFTHEAQAASALQHHNICTIHEIDQTPDGRMFICMDYYAGDTLKARVERGQMAAREAVELAAQAADGLAKAHEAGMVHRDVKPANIAVTHDGVVKILDFGLAMLSDRTRLTKMGTTVGTVAYMSPEQARGDEVTAAADVWSLGVILYEMLAGRMPFRATHEAALVYAILNEKPEPVTRGDIPKALARIVDKAMEKDPTERYRDAGEMARDLRSVASEMDEAERATAGRGSSDTRPAAQHTRYWIPVALIAVIAAALLLLKPVLFDGSVVSAPQPIAVISFENRTGDPEYDYLREVIPNLLITSLEQSKYLSVVTWERMQDLLAQSGREGVTVIDKDTGFEVCRLDGIDTIVLGSFSRAGDVFVTDVKVLDVHSKELLKSASAKGDGVGSILDSQIDELGEDISRGVGLSERKIAAAAARPIAAVTTTSMDAYHYFLQGREELRKRYPADALRSFERAVELDSTFAAAWLYVARAQREVRDQNASNKSYARARTLSASAPEKDRLFIEAMHALIIEKNEAKHSSLLVELTDKYPNEKHAHIRLAVYYSNLKRFDESREAFVRVLALDPQNEEALNGLAYDYARLEDYDKAIEYFQRYLDAHPQDANAYDSMAEAYYRTGDLGRAIEMYERAIALKPDYGAESRIAYVYALQQDYAGAIVWTDRFIAAAPAPGLAAAGRFLKTLFLIHGCRWREAVDTARESRLVLEKLGHQYAVLGTWWMESWALYHLGEIGPSRRCLDEANALAQATNSVTPTSISSFFIVQGRLDLKEGRVDRAEARVEEARSAFDTAPDTTSDRYLYTKDDLLLFEAEILLAKGLADEAIAVCRKRAPVPVPTLGSDMMFFYNANCNRDVLARAFVQKGDLDQAIAEYEKLVTFDPTNKARKLINPLFHYRLARLYEDEGRAADAARSYERFLEICEDAGPELTQLDDARRRLAALAESRAQ